MYPNAAGDVETARQMIEDAGAAGEEVTVYGNNDDPTDKVTEAYAEQLNEIGLDATPEILDGGVYFQTIGNAKTEAQTGFPTGSRTSPTRSTSSSGRRRLTATRDRSSGRYGAIPERVWDLYAQPERAGSSRALHPLAARAGEPRGRAGRKRAHPPAPCGRCACVGGGDGQAPGPLATWRVGLVEATHTVEPRDEGGSTIGLAMRAPAPDGDGHSRHLRTDDQADPEELGTQGRGLAGARDRFRVGIGSRA